MVRRRSRAAPQRFKQPLSADRVRCTLRCAAPGAGEGLAQFKKGFMRFKQEVISRHPAHFAELAASQSPKVMVVACCDSRVDPALLMGAGPGDIFIVRYAAAASTRA